MEAGHDLLKGKTKGVLIIKHAQLGPQDSQLKKSFEDRYLKSSLEGKGMILRSNPKAQIKKKMSIMLVPEDMLAFWCLLLHHLFLFLVKCEEAQWMAP